VEALYQDHLNALRNCEVAAVPAPASAAELAATELESSRQRRAEIEASGLLETGPDGLRHFRARYLIGQVEPFLRWGRFYRDLVSRRIAHELQRDPQPPALPPGYEEDVRRRREATAAILGQSQLLIATMIIAFLVVSWFLRYSPR
jgi:hypothetical protein